MTQANDGVDTAREDNEFTPLRNWFNEFYARDTSKKIKAVKNAQAARGERVNGAYPYGYIVNPSNKNHLLPDPETAHIVKHIFAMYISGARISDIQNWLKENKVMTPCELIYERTGKARYGRAQLGAIHSWSDKTLNDMLGRKEYLGHTITAKRTKLSYKSKKERWNPPEKQHFFPDTHESLIDEATFEIAQKRLATKTRPTKCNEIDLFSGLLFCADCGYKMYLQKGAGTLERKHAYTCGNYRNRARNDYSCTTHYIRKTVIKELVLVDLQRVFAYVSDNEGDFVRKATEHGNMEAKKALAQKQKEYNKANSRLNELDTLFRKLYEDNALGRISDQQFIMLTSGYDDEKNTLKKKVAEFEREINTVTERNTDVDKFVKTVKRYSDIQELNYELVHDFIDRILIHDPDLETATRKIEVFYSFVGQIETDGEPTSNTSYIRRERRNVKSIVI